MFSDTKRMSTFSSEPLNDNIGEKVRGRTPSGKSYRPPCWEYLKSKCTTPSFVIIGILPNAKNTKQSRKIIFGDKCAFMHWQAEEQPSKKPKDNGEHSAVAILEDTRQMGCVFQDAGPPRSSILRKRTSLETN